jgi:hypothetical protein
MTTPFFKLAAAAAISLCASFAMAQPAPTKPMAPAKPAPAAAAPAAAPAATPAPAAKPARSAKSLECSKEADAKGLKGKPRKKFRSACMKGKTPS